MIEIADDKRIVSKNDEADCSELRPTAQSVYVCGRAVSISAISRVTGYSISHISLVLRGQRNPSAIVAQDIAHALKIPTDDLLNYISSKRTDLHIN